MLESHVEAVSAPAIDSKLTDECNKKAKECKGIIFYVITYIYSLQNNERGTTS
jgi:hypothetical protein